MLIVMIHSGGQCWSLWPTLGGQCWSLWPTLEGMFYRRTLNIQSMWTIIGSSLYQVLCSQRCSPNNHYLVLRSERFLQNIKWWKHARQNLFFFVKIHHYVVPDKGCQLLLLTCFIGGHLIYKTCGQYVVTTFIRYYVFNDFCKTAAIIFELFY